jgi:hypothetical protein
VSGLFGLGGPNGSAEPGSRCSSSGCTADATWRVNWRNPRIHTPDRVKVWLACDAHRSTLGDYLSTRGFPVVVTAFDQPVAAVPDAP